VIKEGEKEKTGKEERRGVGNTKDRKGKARKSM
jgi:hypothetical protein